MGGWELECLPYIGSCTKVRLQGGVIYACSRTFKR